MYLWTNSVQDETQWNLGKVLLENGKVEGIEKGVQTGIEVQPRQININK